MRFYSITYFFCARHLLEVTVVLFGMNEEAHIEENLTIAKQAYPNSLTKDELQLAKHRLMFFNSLLAFLTVIHGN